VEHVLGESSAADSVAAAYQVVAAALAEAVALAGLERDQQLQPAVESLLEIFWPSVPRACRLDLVPQMDELLHPSVAVAQSPWDRCLDPSTELILPAEVELPSVALTLEFGSVCLLALRQALGLQGLGHQPFADFRLLPPGLVAVLVTLCQAAKATELGLLATVDILAAYLLEVMPP